MTTPLPPGLTYESWLAGRTEEELRQDLATARGWKAMAERRIEHGIYPNANTRRAEDAARWITDFEGELRRRGLTP